MWVDARISDGQPNRRVAVEPGVGARDDQRCVRVRVVVVIGEDERAAGAQRARGRDVDLGQAAGELDEVDASGGIGAEASASVFGVGVSK